MENAPGNKPLPINKHQTPAQCCAASLRPSDIGSAYQNKAGLPVGQRGREMILSCENGSSLLPGRPLLPAPQWQAPDRFCGPEGVQDFV